MALKFSRLTRPAIRALQLGAKLAEHGITAERQVTGDTRYSVNVMVDGQRLHRVVGRESDGVTREQAERLIERLRTEAREGRLNLAPGRKLHMSFNEAADAYIQRLEVTDGKNIAAKRQHIRDRLKPNFGTLRIDRLTDFGIKRYRKQRLDAGASASTINRELATLSHMLKSARVWKWIRADDVPPIAKTKEDQRPMFVLDEMQARALMTAAVADQDGLTWLFVAFGLNTAMRHREILRARFDQIDPKALRIFVPLAKAGSRDQPITPALAEMLAKQRKMVADPDGWIFPAAAGSRAKQPHRSRMTRQFARAVVSAKLNPQSVTPHTMRRTAITKLIVAGVDLPTVQRISGHKTMTMVLRYFHALGSHVDKAVTVLDFGFTGTVTPELHTSPAEIRQIVPPAQAKL